jgi:hypothetical protein
LIDLGCVFSACCTIVFLLRHALNFFKGQAEIFINTRNITAIKFLKLMKNVLNKWFILWCILAVVAGLFIAWNYSRTNWDDSGISALFIFFTTLIFGYLASKKTWLIALAGSIWIPLISVVSTHNYGGWLALIPGFFGAFLGYLLI